MDNNRSFDVGEERVASQKAYAFLKGAISVREEGDDHVQ